MIRTRRDCEYNAVVNIGGHIVTETNIALFAAHATIVADTKFVSETQKKFPISFRNILCLQQMFSRLPVQGNIMSN